MGLRAGLGFLGSENIWPHTLDAAMLGRTIIINFETKWSAYLRLWNSCSLGVKMAMRATVTVKNDTISHELLYDGDQYGDKEKQKYSKEDALGQSKGPGDGNNGEMV